MLALPWREVHVEQLVFEGHRVVLGEGQEESGQNKNVESWSDNVGTILWDGSVHLARWLCSNRALVEGCVVLEMGAGVGLCRCVSSREHLI